MFIYATSDSAFDSSAIARRSRCSKISAFINVSVKQTQTRLSQQNPSLFQIFLSLYLLVLSLSLSLSLAHTNEQLNSFTLCGVSTFESILPIYQYPLQSPLLSLSASVYRSHPLSPSLSQTQTNHLPHSLTHSTTPTHTHPQTHMRPLPIGPISPTEQDELSWKLSSPNVFFFQPPDAAQSGKGWVVSGEGRGGRTSSTVFPLVPDRFWSVVFFLQTRASPHHWKTC